MAWVSGLMAEIPASTIIMKTNAAVGLVVCGLALILTAAPLRGPNRRRAVLGCAGFVGLLGAATLAEHLFGWNPGIDELIATEPAGAAATVSPNRMGPPASLSFLLLGTSLLLAERVGRRRRALHEPLALTVALLALLSIVGHLYGASALYAIAQFTGIAWPTAFSLLILAIGVLCARPDEGIMAHVMAADDPGGAIIRALLGPIVAVPVVLGWVRLVSERLGWVDAPMGTSLIMLIFIVTFSLLLLFTSRHVSLSSAALRESEREVRSQKELLAVTLASIGDAVIVTDADGAVTFLNAEAERLTGWTDRQAREQPLSEIFGVVNEQSAESVRYAVEDVLHHGATKKLAGDSLLLTRDGRKVPVEASVALIRPAAGQVRGEVLVFRDVTERRRADEALRDSERKYRIVANHTHAWEFWSDENGRLLYHSPSCARITGYEPEAFEADPSLLDRIIHPEDRHVYEAHRGATHEVCATEEAEFRIVRRDGAVRWISHVCMPVHDSDGRFRGIRGSNRDVTDWKETQQALNAARDSAESAKAEAERANEAKDRFLATLSHELRTPLTPVLTGIAMLRDDPRCDPALVEMLRRNIEIEARLIDDLLDLTRIARGKIELEKKPVLLCEVIERAVEVCKPDIEARRLHFGVDMGTCPPHRVHADAARLQQVFWNLLKNAVKFTPTGGCVGVRCRAHNQTVVVEVTDSGVGIEPEDLPRVFTAFEQVERSPGRHVGGLGLGLAIARAIVELHDGRIEAYSEGPQKGTTFRVSLPMASAALAETGGSASPAATKATSRPLHILLVEDHGDTANVTKVLLTMAGHNVRVAGDVATALDEASRSSFDVLVSDLGLPDGSGADLLRELRRRGYTMPAIAVSGYGREEDVRRSRDAGFAEHLVKPTSPDRLMDVIAATVARVLH